MFKSLQYSTVSDKFIITARLVRIELIDVVVKIV